MVLERKRKDSSNPRHAKRHVFNNQKIRYVDEEQNVDEWDNETLGKMTSSPKEYIDGSFTAVSIIHLSKKYCTGKQQL